MNMHEAELYLRNVANPPYLYVMIDGKRSKLFVNDRGNNPTFGIIAPGKSKRGYLFSQWASIERICYPRSEEHAKEKERKLVLKYQREAAKATFTNQFLRKIKDADVSKSLYENGITTGNSIDGQTISLDSIRRWCGDHVYFMFKQALRERRCYDSSRFNFRGFDGTLWVEPFQKGDTYPQSEDVTAGFSKEYRNCANGFYYLLINDDKFIGCDVD